MQGVEMQNFNNNAPHGEFVKSSLKVRSLMPDELLKDLELPEGKTIAELLNDETEPEDQEEE